MQNSIVITKPLRGEEVDLCEREIREYITATEEKECCRLLQEHVGKRLDVQALVLSWSGGEGAYTLHIDTTPDFSTERRVVCHQPDWRADALLPDTTYYYKITDENGNVSNVDFFTTKALPLRWITLRCAVNARDTGGWEAQDGKVVRYGKIYRGGRLDRAEGEEMDDGAMALGIRAEIDLRNPGGDDGAQVTSFFGKDVLYLKTPMTQSCYIFPFFKQTEPWPRQHDDRTPASLRAIFACLADEKNYPVYYHCNAGADRTGTLAFLLNGLLGVSYEDLTRDFELTSFSEIGFRLRSEMQGESFTDSGVMQDNYYNYVAWGKLYRVMMQEFAAPDGKLSSAIERYLTEVCKVPTAHIKAFREIMLTNKQK